ncbi:hypothetical protein Tco_1338041 [Tanacetum coccineum]
MRDFYKTHPSGSGAVKIIPSVTSERTGVKPGVPDVTEEESSKSKAESWGNDEDDSNNEQDSSGEDKSDQEENEEDEDDEEEVRNELIKTPSNDSDNEDETKITDKAEVDTDKGFVQEEGTDAKTKVPVTSSSHSSDLAAKFLNFLDIPHTDAEIVSPMDVHVHHEVPSKQTPTLLTIPVSVITDTSPVYSTIIPQSLPSFTPPPQQSTSTPPPTTEATNPLSTLPDFASVFQFNNRVTTLEKEVAELKKDPLHTQVTALVDDHLDTRLGATRDEFMNFLSASLTTRITEQMVQESLEDVVLAKESSQPQSSYEAAATLTEFELKKILIDKMDKSESYLAAPEHRECYEGLIKSYDLDKTIFSTYGKVYSLNRSRKDKDKDEDPSAGSDRRLKKRKTSKDAEPTKRKFVQSEEPEFEVVDSDMPQDQEENLGKDDKETKEKVASKRDWSTKPTQPQEPTDPDWNVDKTPQQGQNQSWLMTLASSTKKPSKTFDELMSTPIDFSAFIMNGLKINKCYKALSEKLDWENPKGGDYPFDLTKPLPLVMSRNRQKVPVDYFFNNDLKYLKGGISTMTYMTSLTKTKASQYDLPGIEDMNRLTNLSGDDVSDFAIALRMFTRSLVIQKRVEDLQLEVESYQKKINVTKPETTKPGIRKRDPYTPYQDPQGFIYVDNYGRNRLMRSYELYKFSDTTLTGLRTSLDDITKNI